MLGKFSTNKPCPQNSKVQCLNQATHIHLLKHSHGLPRENFHSPFPLVCRVCHCHLCRSAQSCWLISLDTVTTVSIRVANNRTKLTVWDISVVVVANSGPLVLPIFFFLWEWYGEPCVIISRHLGVLAWSVHVCQVWGSEVGVRSSSAQLDHFSSFVVVVFWWDRVFSPSLELTNWLDQLACLCYPRTGATGSHCHASGFCVSPGGSELRLVFRW